MMHFLRLTFRLQLSSGQDASVRLLLRQARIGHGEL